MKHYFPAFTVLFIAMLFCVSAYGALKKHTFSVNGDIKKFNQFIQKFRQK